MSLGSWNPTMVAQRVLWILLGLLLQLKPGTGGSGGRDPGPGPSSVGMYRCPLCVQPCIG